MGPQTRLARPRHRGGVALTLLLALLAVSAAAPAGVEEAELEAAYLYNFSKFVLWPSSALPSPGTPLILCIYGRAPVSEAIATLDGKQAQGHRIRVGRLSRGDSLEGCHVVYVSSSESPYLSPLLRAVAGRPALTVSAIPGFAAAGGMIGFVKDDNRLRFEINTASAEAVGLSISSQLLKLATKVVQE